MNLTIDPEKKSGDLRDLARRARRMAAGLSQAADRALSGKIEAWEVGAEVGNVKNNRPELMERVGLL